MGFAIVADAIPILRPFPNVAGHVVKAKSISGKRADWSGAEIAIFLGIFDGEQSLPGVGLG